MTYKQVLFQSAAREKVVRGATQLANAVRITLGPKSNAVSVASILLLTEATMTEIEEPKAAAAAAPEMEL